MEGGWGGVGAVHFRPDTKGGGGGRFTVLFQFTVIRFSPDTKSGEGGECIAAGRVRLSTPCVHKLSKAERACIRRWHAIVKFTSIAVVELLSRSSRH